MLETIPSHPMHTKLCKDNMLIWNKMVKQSYYKIYEVIINLLKLTNNMKNMENMKNVWNLVTFCQRMYGYVTKQVLNKQIARPILSEFGSIVTWIVTRQLLLFNKKRKKQYSSNSPNFDQWETKSRTCTVASNVTCAYCCYRIKMR